MTTTHSSRETMGSMAATLTMPYTLTPGRATGLFLAALAQKQILGSRCEECASVRVPAQDVCPDCGVESPKIVLAPETGRVEAWTQTDQGCIALVRLDGTNVALLHRLVSADGAEVGGRVSAVWCDDRSGTILDIAGFAVSPEAAVGAVLDFDFTSVEPLKQMDYTMKLDYQHAYGHFYGTLFDGVKNDRRIRGVRCPSCRSVLVPPRAYCDACFVPTGEWIDVPDTGVVQACSVVHIEFMGQRVPPPYVYAEVVLDGTATRLIHTVGGLSAEHAREGGVRPGSRVQAVWSDRTTGSLSDIEYFRVVGEGE
jgi:uncharacterized OB-fold protein